MTDPRIEAAARAMFDRSKAEVLAARGFTTSCDYDEISEKDKEYWRDMISPIIAAADAAAWRPIASAPKDGTQILLFRPETDISTQRLTAGAWYEPEPALSHMCPDINEDDMPEPSWVSWDGGFSTNNPQPTHWQPLPAPPASIAELGGVDG